MTPRARSVDSTSAEDSSSNWGFIPMSHARATLPDSTEGGNSTTWNVSHSSYSLVYGGRTVPLADRLKARAFFVTIIPSSA